ncbi:hypothetical protein [Luteimonas aquatica]|uniref:hypothetical protein n=1 Tax=Luteimonas aquatica TaxID=450364 RepID=UPI0030DA1BF9
MQNLRALALKAFVPARDFAASEAFYADLGFVPGVDAGDLVHFRLGEVGFLLQDFYGEAFAATWSCICWSKTPTHGTAGSCTRTSRRGTAWPSRRSSNGRGACGISG